MLAACTSFQFAAGIPPGEMRFDGGFTPTSEDLHGNSGLERTLLHLAYNNDAMEIMDTPVGRAILSYKWNTFGKRAYLQSMVWPIGIIFFTTLQSVAWYMVAAYQYKGRTALGEDAGRLPDDPALQRAEWTETGDCCLQPCASHAPQRCIPLP